MHAPKAPPPPPSQPLGADREDVYAEARHALTIRGALALCVASFGVMIPWPLLGIALTRGMFDQSNEWVLLFGGLTGLPLMILAVIGVPESVWLSLLLTAWVATVVGPVIWLARRPRTRLAIVLVVIAQAAFSFAQAALGALMILGKSV